MNRSMNNVPGKLGMLLCAALLFGCTQTGTEAGTAAGDTPAATKSADGITFTISGPAFSEPATFVISGDTPRLQTHLSDSMFSLMLSDMDGLQSIDGKHLVQTLIIGTEPAGVGESTEAAGVSDASFAFDTDIGTASSQGPSMKFNYSKGERQPMRIVMEVYEEGERAVGHFSGRVQRTNIKSTHEIYEVTGRFNVRD